MDNNYDDNHVIQVSDNNGGNQNGGIGLGVTSMVLGIVSILFSCCFYYVSFPCGIIGLILGAVAIKKNNKGKGMAIAGIVLSIISLALAVVAIIMGGAILAELGFSDMF